MEGDASLLIGSERSDVLGDVSVLVVVDADQPVARRASELW